MKVKLHKAVFLKNLTVPQPLMEQNVHVHYHVQQHTPASTAPNPVQMNGFHLSTHFVKIHFNINPHPRLSPRFSQQNLVFIFIPMHATCPVNLAPTYLISEDYFIYQDFQLLKLYTMLLVDE